MRRNIKFENFASNVGKIKLLKRILKWPYYTFYLKAFRKSLNNNMINNGESVMIKFDETMRSIDVPYSLAFGTLLGAIREKGFIKHDNDIDVAVWYNKEDIAKIWFSLENAGFKRIRKIEVDNGDFAYEETYSLQGVNVDIFYYYKYNENMSYSAFFTSFEDCSGYEDSEKKHGGIRAILIKQPSFNLDIVYTPFENIKLPVFKNAEEFIESVYGVNWRTPDPSYTPDINNSDSYIVLKDKVGHCIWY